MNIETVIDRSEIIDVLVRYAVACDSRNWNLFKDIFTPDVETDYGDPYKYSTRDELVNMVKSMLGGCGPTQHMISNFRIEMEGSGATSICSVRAFHAGIREAEGKTFEMWGEYQDRLVRTENGWRIKARKLVSTWIQGSYEVLGPPVE